MYYILASLIVTAFVGGGTYISQHNYHQDQVHEDGTDVASELDSNTTVTALS